MIKLLLADDSVTIQRVVELTFSGEDVQVISVSDGEQAIARLSSERPDIVLADIGMPKRDGYEVAAFVKGHPDLAHIPVLLLAGAFEPVDEARAKEVQCDGVLVKPFEPQQVIARVRELVDGLAPEPVPEPVPEPAPPHVSIADELLAALPMEDTPEWPPISTAAPRADAVPVREAEHTFDPLIQPQDADLGSLDDYFNRLGAAFGTLGSPPAPEPPPVVEDPFAVDDLPTIESLLAGPEVRTPPSSAPMDFGRTTPPGPAGPAVPAAAAAAAPPAGNAIAEVFRAVFAAEQGNTDALRRLQAPPAQAHAAVTDDMVNEVTRRVLERLAPGTARQLVADIVSDIAERLVREEIQRIRNQQ